VSHFFLMLLMAVVLSTFFTVLWRRERAAQIRLFVQLLVGMVGGGLLVAWIMYFLPSGPPAPIP